MEFVDDDVTFDGPTGKDEDENDDVVMAGSTDDDADDDVGPSPRLEHQLVGVFIFIVIH